MGVQGVGSVGVWRVRVLHALDLLVAVDAGRTRDAALVAHLELSFQ